MIPFRDASPRNSRVDLPECERLYAEFPSGYAPVSMSAEAR